jgi:hypothetical protein
MIEHEIGSRLLLNSLLQAAYTSIKEDRSLKYGMSCFKGVSRT